MKQLLDSNLYVGAIEDLSQINKNNWSILHATQTVHYKIFGWNRTTNKPNKNHPNYIYYEEENILSLNWVDGGAHLYKWTGLDTFIKILNFIDKWITKRKVLVHCDKGYSRSPSICLLYLAKRREVISNESFLSAKEDFVKIYPNYNPGGIGRYIRNNWNSIY